MGLRPDFLQRPTGANGDREDFVWGYDAIRCVAMLFVALRHLLSIYDHESPAMSYFVGLPQLVVLSGYLAFQSRGNPWGWLRRRLARIYPSYLLCITMLILVAWSTGYKPVSAGLIVAQVMGIAALTNAPGQLIGVHTWFVTFICICYGVAALIRWRRWLLWPTVTLAVVLVYRGLPHGDLFLSFGAGALASTAPAGVRRNSVLLLVFLAGLFVLTDRAIWLVAASGVLALFLGSFLDGPRPYPVALVSRFTYEFYLCHGPVFLVLERIGGLSFAANLTAGTIVATLAAAALHKAGFSMRNLASKAFAAGRANDATGGGAALQAG